MKTLVIWLLGTVYVLAALAGMAVVVWAADHGDNSTDPTHWGIGSALVLAPLATLGVLRLVGPWIRERVGHGRGTILLGAGLAAGAGLALVVGARAIIADASACSDDDCVTIAVPVGVLCVLGAWSLPLGLSALRRLRYPAPLMSVGLVAAMTTLVAGSAAAVQSSGQEDNYADLTPGVVVSAWILPASLAVVAMVVVRGPTGRATHRTGQRPGTW